MPRPHITQNHHVLAVHSLEVSGDFFVDTLGFRVVFDDGGNWLFVRRDGCLIMMGRCDDAIAPADLGDHQYFGYLVVDDVDAYHAEVVAAGGTPKGPPEDKPWGMREFGIATPEGHRLMIGQDLEAPDA